MNMSLAMHTGNGRKMYYQYIYVVHAQKNALRCCTCGHCLRRGPYKKLFVLLTPGLLCTSPMFSLHAQSVCKDVGNLYIPTKENN